MPERGVLSNFRSANPGILLCPHCAAVQLPRAPVVMRPLADGRYLCEACDTAFSLPEIADP